MSAYGNAAYYDEGNERRPRPTCKLAIGGTPGVAEAGRPLVAELVAGLLALSSTARQPQAHLTCRDAETEITVRPARLWPVRRGDPSCAQ